MKKDLYQTVTDRIVAQLEQGAKPWVKPWNADNRKPMTISRPLRHNNQRYSGVNILILWSAAEEKGYSARHWMTFKQAQELGACVRKGEKSESIVYASTFTKTDEKNEEHTIPFLKSYCVFNAEQIDNLPEHFYSPTVAPSSPINNPDSENAIAQRFIDGTNAIIRKGGDRAFYTPAQDFVQMPLFVDFKSAQHYYSTAFHELTHWTKHETRLNREFGRKRWGDEGYATEELVAELGASFLCADLGLSLATDPRPDHADYLASWLKVLKNDKRAIFTASSYASKAAEYLHGLQAVQAEAIAA